MTKKGSAFLWLHTPAGSGLVVKVAQITSVEPADDGAVVRMFGRELPIRISETPDDVLMMIYREENPERDV